MKKMKNETRILLKILKAPEMEYNANSLAKTIKITAMGVLKILKRLEKDEILISRKVGNASIYKINWKNDYAIDYAKFALREETASAQSYIKRWVNEIKKVNEADIAIIFGSILNEGKSNDVDILFVVDKKKFSRLKKKIDSINRLSEKKVHPVYQTIDDFKKNISKTDKIIIDAVKGIIAFGHEKFIQIIKEMETQKWV